MRRIFKFVFVFRVGYVKLNNPWINPIIVDVNLSLSDISRYKIICGLDYMTTIIVELSWNLPTFRIKRVHETLANVRSRKKIFILHCKKLFLKLESMTSRLHYNDFTVVPRLPFIYLLSKYFTRDLPTFRVTNDNDVLLEANQNLCIQG